MSISITQLFVIIITLQSLGIENRLAYKIAVVKVVLSSENFRYREPMGLILTGFVKRNVAEDYYSVSKLQTIFSLARG
jgi:hypothetical protein